MKIEFMSVGIHNETMNEGEEDSEATRVETHGCGGGLERRGGVTGDSDGRFLTFPL